MRLAWCEVLVKKSGEHITPTKELNPGAKTFVREGPRIKCLEVKVQAEYKPAAARRSSETAWK